MIFEETLDKKFMLFINRFETNTYWNCGGITKCSTTEHTNICSRIS